MTARGRKLLLLALLAVALVAAALLRQPSWGTAPVDGGTAAEALTVPGEGAPATSPMPTSRPAESRSPAAPPDAVGEDPGSQDVFRGVIYRMVQGQRRGAVAGATVTVFPWLYGEQVAPRDASPLATTRSDREGRFVVPGPIGSTRLWGRFEASGCAVSGALLSRGKQLHVLMDTLETVRGRVTRGPARDPVAGIEIESTSAKAPEPVVARTDGQGEFQLVTPGWYPLRLVLRLPDELPLVRTSVRNVAGQRVDIHLDGRSTISGEVVDLVASLPVAGASVSGHCQTDALGRFQFVTSAQGECPVEVTAPGYASVTASLSTAAPGRQRIALLREALVTGSVRNGAGQPVAGASVLLALWQQALRDRDRLTVPELYGKCGKVTPPPNGASRVLEPPFHGPVRTGQDGRFRFAGVGAGAGVVVCRVVASGPGFAEAESALLEVPFPGGRADVDLVLHRAASVRGTVRMQGVPARAWVRIDTAGGMREETGCDALGQYELTGIPAGEAQLESMLAGRSPVHARRSLLVQEGGEQVVDFELVPNPSAITGRVVVAGAPPAELGLANALEERTDGAVRRYHGPVDGQGSFRIPVPDDPAARFTLSFGSVPGRMRGGRSAVRPGEDVGIVEVMRLCQVRAQLVDAATRSPLAVKACSWRRHDTEVWQDATAELGPRHRKPQDAFEVWLPSGLLDLRVEPVSAEHEVFEWAGVTVADNQPGVALPAQRR